MQKKFQVNAPIAGKKPGEIIEIECDNEGLPLDQFWYRRYLDSRIDNCISAVEESNKPKKERLTNE